MPPRKPRTDYSRRPKAAFLPFPAVILDPAVLEDLGVLPGTRPDENPPKVVLSRADWETVLADPTRARKALRFLGRTRADNPLKGGLPEPENLAPRTPKATRSRKPSPFAHLRGLSLPEATAQAQRDHAARLAAGADEEASLATLVRALETVRRWDQQRVIPAPLAAPEGEDPPTPTEQRRQAAAGGGAGGR